jgi:hypothetical protein
MAIVERNDRITVTKFNTCDMIEIQIKDEDGVVMLYDKDVRFLFMLLAKWCVEDVAEY